MGSMNAAGIALSSIAQDLVKCSQSARATGQGIHAVGGSSHILCRGLSHESLGTPDIDTFYDWHT